VLLQKEKPAMSKISKNQSAPGSERLIDQINIEMDEPVDLAVIVVKQTGIRCKLIHSQLPVTYRTVNRDVEGEIITVIPSKIWQFKNTVYMSGETIDRRLDIDALELTPLEIKEVGIFEPDEAELLDEYDPYEKYYRPIIAFGPRKKFEMEQVLPFYDPESMDDDPISKSVDAFQNGDNEAGFKILKDLLTEDLRCIDAHVHLGNWEFNNTTGKLHDETLKHYEVGVKIAELSFDNDFRGVLPWDHINNRPYLRCLHGYGLSLWRTGNKEAARVIFEKMLWLNPKDNQGIRSLLAEIDAGNCWQE
jgi:tetratricopeptide (TPR) repeat protein